MVWAAVLPLLPSKWKSFPSRKEKEAEKWDPERVNVATIPADSVTNYFHFFLVLSSNLVRFYTTIQEWNGE